ncbi:PQQ-dependent sugar dehydrogenase [Azohydromonas caseinilytica]|uniref:PQQ-dependent sugar dehydrogenase n=1 Tax=Azohydromonas caseinilytica TaxID=2728836 RepID=A0A848F508_9BURK|nr:PQQ-dependent sugar dehydrogenase [Azohydromonas caseinilytica]NML14704.1 PQQ-dependent sugar dehydrogenase [Azohydromonas caseinilytica]
MNQASNSHGPRRRSLLGGVLLAGLAPGVLRAQSRPSQGDVEPEVVTVARGLEQPWSLAFLPDGRLLVTEKAGRLRVVADGRPGAPLQGVPAVDDRGQGGLLDVVLAPDFASSRAIYLSFSEPAPGGRGNGTAVARAVLENQGLSNVKVVFRQEPKVSSTAHYGGRLVFARDGRLFITLGDRFSRRDDAQDLSNHLGKIVRIEADGGVPRDNPLVNQPGARPEVWSWGHRNVQGAALHPRTGELWTHEHGPQGGDELNIVTGGRNHGWPVITAGREYGSGAVIGQGETRADVAPALRTWVPSVAPSGMAFLTSDRYPGWQGSLFIGTLKAQRLIRLTLDGNRVTGEQRLLAGLGERLRDVRQGPDGRIYLLTDSDEGRVLRLG